MTIALHTAFLEFKFPHCLPNTLHCTLNTANCTPHTAHCTLHNVPCPLYTAIFTLNTEQCKLYTAHYTRALPLLQDQNVCIFTLCRYQLWFLKCVYGTLVLSKCLCHKVSSVVSAHIVIFKFYWTLHWFCCTVLKNATKPMSH